MKRIPAIVLIVCMSWAEAAGAGEVVRSASRDAAYTFPSKYPLWLARILAPFGVAEAQALVGFQTLQRDPCKGANLLQSAARQHQFFAEMQLLGYYHVTGKRNNDLERIKTAFLWHLHFMSHFPGDKDESHHIVAMLKLTPDQESSVREKFKTWKPEDDPLVEPTDCPGRPFDFY